MNEFKEHTLEIRFKPNARSLDKRGEIAEALATPLLNQWNIATNRIAFFSESDPAYKGFFSFRNLGIKTLAPHDRDFFLEKCAEFLKPAWNYFPTSEIIRIGIRVKTLTEVESYTSTFAAFREKFLALPDETLASFGGDLVDVGFPLNFVDGKNSFRLNTGPMQAQEYDVHFENTEGMSKPGIFLDVDYYGTEFSPNIKQKNVKEFIEIGLNKADEVKKVLHSLVLASEN